MTYKELIEIVAEQHGVSKTKTAAIVRGALKLAAEQARIGSAPTFHNFGRIVAVPVRSRGKGYTGMWERPGRKRLALRTQRTFKA